MLERAIDLALRVHAGQTRKNGDPYILHPLRVMLSVDVRGLDEGLVRSVAVLHDVLEDSHRSATPVSDAVFREYGVGSAYPFVCLLTRTGGEPYEEYIHRLSHDRVARRVKIADLRDNMNLDEIPTPNLRDLERYRKYRSMLKMLELREHP